MRSPSGKKGTGNGLLFATTFLLMSVNAAPIVSGSTTTACSWTKSNDALALPVVSVHPGGYHDPLTYNTFIKEYQWIKDMLDKMHPDNEFLIVPSRMYHRPPIGWIIIPLRWRGHIIYRKPLKQSA